MTRNLNEIALLSTHAIQTRHYYMYRSCQSVCCINGTNRSGSPSVGGKAENQLDVINNLLITHLTETDAL